MSDAWEDEFFHLLAQQDKDRKQSQAASSTDAMSSEPDMPQQEAKRARFADTQSNAPTEGVKELRAEVGELNKRLAAVQKDLETNQEKLVQANNASSLLTQELAELKKNMLQDPIRIVMESVEKKQLLSALRWCNPKRLTRAVIIEALQPHGKDKRVGLLYDFIKSLGCALPSRDTMQADKASHYAEILSFWRINYATYDGDDVKEMAETFPLQVFDRTLYTCSGIMRKYAAVCPMGPGEWQEDTTGLSLAEFSKSAGVEPIRSPDRRVPPPGWTKELKKGSSKSYPVYNGPSGELKFSQKCMDCL